MAVSKLFRDLQEETKRAKEHRDARIINWRLSIGFLAGDQWIYYNDSRDPTIDRLKSFGSLPGQRIRVRAVHNLILPRFVRTKARLLSYLPKLIVRPSAPSDDTRKVSRVATALVDYQRRAGKLEQAARGMVGWAMACGLGGLWAGFDQFARPTASARGEIKFTALSPMQIIPDPYADSVDEARWVTIVESLEPAKAADVYPILKGRVALDRAPEDLWQGVMPGGTGRTLPVQKPQRVALVYHRFDKPCASFPDGRYVAWNGDTLVRSRKELPWGLREIPVALTPYYEVSGQPWGLGYVLPLIQPQRTHNSIRSRESEYRNLHSAPHLLAPRGSIHPEDWASWSGNPGQKTLINAMAGEPKYLIGPNVSHMGEDLSTLRDLNEIAQSPRAAMGESPTSERSSGPVISALLGTTAEGLAEAVCRIYEALELCGRVGLHIAASQYDTSRWFSVMGDDRTSDFFGVGAEGSLEGVAGENILDLDRLREMVSNGVDVVVEVDPGAPMTRQERRAELLQLWAAQGLSPEEFRGNLEQGATDDLYAGLGQGAFQRTIQAPRGQGGAETGVA